MPPLKTLSLFVDEQAFREETHRRAALMVDRLETLLGQARQGKLPAFFVEQLEQAHADGPAIVDALDRMRKEKMVAARNPLSAQESVREAVKQMRPYDRWSIQWHLRHAGSDACERCLSTEIAYHSQRHRECLECGHHHRLPGTVEQWRASIFADKKPGGQPGPLVCKFSGCTGDHYGLGFCQRHWQQHKRHPDDMWPIRPKQCKVDGCHRSVLALGFCRGHRSQHMKEGAVVPPRPTMCQAADCPERAARKGWCPRHYAQVRQHGTIATLKEKQAHDLSIPRRDDLLIRLRCNWTQTEIHELLRTYNEGYDRREMAQALGRTYAAVWKMITNLRKEGVLSRELPTPRLWRVAIQMRKEGQLNYEIDQALDKAVNYTANLFKDLRRRGIDVPPSPYLHGSRKNDTRD